MKVTLKKHPELDFFIGFMGGPLIPTKQDKFKPIYADKTILIKDGVEKQLEDGLDLYVKKRVKNSLKEFEEAFSTQIKEQLTDEHPYSKDIKLEVVISVSMDEKRINEVDVDNLTKSVLDCFTGTVFEDDSQVVKVLASKNVNDFMSLNGLMVGIRKIATEDESWFNNIKLAYLEQEK